MASIFGQVFISHPGLYLCQTVASCIYTKHKALLITDVNHKLKYEQPKPKVYRSCFDLREPHIQALRTGLANYNWNQLLQEQQVQSLYDDLLKVLIWFINSCIPVKYVCMSQKCPKFITPLILNLLRRRGRLMRKGRVDQAEEISVKVGRLIAEERAILLSKVNTHDTKELWSSTGHATSSKSARSVFDLGLRFDNINDMNPFFAKITLDPDYDLQNILSHVKPCTDGS